MSREDREPDIKEDTIPAGGQEEPREGTPAEERGAEAAAAESPVEALEAEIAELKDKILRMAAEDQNTRKRLAKQMQDAHKYRHQDILRDLAEVIDNFERAIDSSTESKDFDTFHEGILMIEKQFSGMLTEKYGLEKLGSAGEAFDPSSHEAMMMEESPDVDVDTVKQVFQAGYRLHDRVLRPAKVIVQKPGQAAAAEAEGAESGENGK